MKVNTDGVLLGAMAGMVNPRRILDLGTGTGVIALMLAQRFPDARVEAIEIDLEAAAQAQRNFEQSVFSSRLQLWPGDFNKVLSDAKDIGRHELIVSNPPFYLNALPSPAVKKSLAKHADENFFEKLIRVCTLHLTAQGQCWFILPPKTAALVTGMAIIYGLYPQHKVFIKSFAGSEPHRVIMAFTYVPGQETEEELIIYSRPRVYTAAYQELLKDFLLIF